MKNGEAIFIKGKRKYLFCADEQGVKLLSHLIEMAKEEGISYEWLHIVDGYGLALQEIMSDQKMGTYLYVALPYSELKHVQVLAESIGYSYEEAQFIGYGEKTVQVFCCRCHGINIALENQMELVCDKCRLTMSVSDHYSALHHAFLGYLAKL